jgi:hypothetical protein
MLTNPGESDFSNRVILVGVAKFHPSRMRRSMRSAGTMARDFMGSVLPG